MTREERELLLKDLCGRLSYGFIVGSSSTSIKIHITANTLNWFTNYIHSWDIESFKPFLRSMSSMTEEEKFVYGDLCYAIISDIPKNEQKHLDELYDWLNENHFDYRGLIEKGLAIEAPQDMYC